MATYSDRLELKEDVPPRSGGYDDEKYTLLGSCPSGVDHFFREKVVILHLLVPLTILKKTGKFRIPHGPYKGTVKCRPPPPVLCYLRKVHPVFLISKIGEYIIESPYIACLFEQERKPEIEIIEFFCCLFIL